MGVVGVVVSVAVGVYLLRKYRERKWGKCTSSRRLDGKVVVVTGANSGLGKEAAKDLAGRGALVVLACRNKEAGLQAVKEIRTTTGDGELIVMELDLGNLASVRTFSAALLQKFDHLDILINNAGVYVPPNDLATTSDGFEIHFGVNHLGHFALTQLLLPRLQETPGARVVTVASSLYKSGKIDLDDLESKNGWDRSQRNALYSNSKLANIMHSQEIARRTAGSQVRAFALCPGFVHTGLFRYSAQRTSLLVKLLVAPVMMFFMRNAKQGAQSIIHCAVSEELDDKEWTMVVDCKPAPVTEVAQDPVTAQRLWEASVALAGDEGMAGALAEVGRGLEDTQKGLEEAGRGTCAQKEKQEEEEEEVTVEDLLGFENVTKSMIEVPEEREERQGQRDTGVTGEGTGVTGEGTGSLDKGQIVTKLVDVGDSVRKDVKESVKDVDVVSGVQDVMGKVEKVKDKLAGSESSVEKVMDKLVGSESSVEKVMDKVVGSESSVEKVMDKLVGSENMVDKVTDKLVGSENAVEKVTGKLAGVVEKAAEVTEPQRKVEKVTEKLVGAANLVEKAAEKMGSEIEKATEKLVGTGNSEKATEKPEISAGVMKSEKHTEISPKKVEEKITSAPQKFEQLPESPKKFDKVPESPQKFDKVPDVSARVGNVSEPQGEAKIKLSTTPAVDDRLKNLPAGAGKVVAGAGKAVAGAGVTNRQVVQDEDDEDEGIEINSETKYNNEINSHTEEESEEDEDDDDDEEMDEDEDEEESEEEESEEEEEGAVGDKQELIKRSPKRP